MEVSVIIINYNTKDITLQCIESIKRHTCEVEYEIILVDNGSSDGSSEYFRDYPGIIFLELKTNIGFGKANNEGYKAATGKYVFLLNSDTILLNNAIKEFVIAIESLPKDVGCIGAILKQPDGHTPNNSFSKFPSLISNLNFFKKLYLKIGKTEKTENLFPPFAVDYIIGADLFIRRSVIEKHGLFDPDFFMYFEESNMQLRYARNGVRRMIVKGPEIIHLEGASFNNRGKLKGKKAQMYYESMNLYMRKRYPCFKYWLFKIIAIAYIPLIIKNEDGMHDSILTINKLFK